MLPVIPIWIVILLLSSYSLLSIQTYMLIRDKSKTVEERLDELERLLKNGKISKEEYSSARKALFEKYA